MSELERTFVPNMTRALMKAMELDVLAVGPDNQTASDLNTINGAHHRYVAGGTGDVMTINDLAKARYALKMANVPDRNLIGIVDPSVGYTFSTLTNISDMSFNPKWEGIVETGITSDMKFIRNIHGFDIYESQNLKSGISETINSDSVTNGVANVFFSAEASVLPFVGQVRQAPVVESEYNKDLQRDEYVMTARYGFDLFRPENLVTIISDDSQVYA